MVAITFSNVVGDICSHGRPVVTLGIGPMCQWLAAWVVFAYAFMKFCKYVLPLLLSEAFKIGYAQGSLIQLFVNQGESCYLDLDLVGLSFVIR